MPTWKRLILKWFIYVTYTLMLIGVVILAGLFVWRTIEYNKLNDSFNAARNQLNSESQNQQITIDDLKAEFERLTKKVQDLEKENTTLKGQLQTTQIEGYGRISGKIFPVISSSGSGFNQYQRVCAENVENKNIQFCTTVSALGQNYGLYLPQGKYNVYAELVTDTTKRAYYTGGVNCAQSGRSDCNVNDTKQVEVIVEAGKEVKNVDPVAWTQLAAQ